MKTTMKDFYKSQSIFENFINNEFTQKKCIFQMYDHEQGILIEEWLLNNDLYLIKIHKNGNGFDYYRLVR